MNWFKWEPKIERAITITELKPILRKLAPTAGIFYLDRTYFIPSDPADVMSMVRSWKYRYIKASRDCDDFVRIFRGDLSKRGLGNILAMDCVIEYSVLNVKKSHAVIAFLRGGELVYGEPQTGRGLDMTRYPNARIIRLIV